jgi:dTDP-4-dehydrorhamnose 3,5-epimerase
MADHLRWHAKSGLVHEHRRDTKYTVWFGSLNGTLGLTSPSRQGTTIGLGIGRNSPIHRVRFPCRFRKPGAELPSCRIGEQMLLELDQPHLLAAGDAVADEVQVRRAHVDDALAGRIGNVRVANVPFLGHSPVQHSCPAGDLVHRHGERLAHELERGTHTVTGDAAVQGKRRVHRGAHPPARFFGYERNALPLPHQQARYSLTSTIKFSELALPGAFAINLEPSEDARGTFERTFCVDEFAQYGWETRVAQCSTSTNRQRATLRGMHLQRTPHEETKLVRCTRGAAFDVVVDLRPDSPAFGQWLSLNLHASALTELYVPRGCAHGFLTLEADTQIEYLISTAYARRHRLGSGGTTPPSRSTGRSCPKCCRRGTVRGRCSTSTGSAAARSTLVDGPPVQHSDPDARLSGVEGLGPAAGCVALVSADPHQAKKVSSLNHLR